jgi:HlyD family secretion protein
MLTPKDITTKIKKRTRAIPGRTVLIIALTVILAAGGLAWRLRATASKNGGYTTASVAYGDIEETIGASGNIVAEQSVTLTFKTEGYVKACYVKLGDQVTAGQALALEEATDLQSSLDQALASLESAQANYDKLVATKPQQIAQLQAQVDSARATVERDQQLLAIGAISQATLDADNLAYQSALYTLAQNQGNADVVAAAAQVKNAQAQVATARDNLENAEMIAPFDGYISSISGNAGQWTGSGTSTSSNQFSIVMTSIQLQIDAQINEADISKVSVGQAVTFTVNTYPNETFTGKITALSPNATTVSNVQMYEALISIDDYSKLKSGLPASITIITASAGNVLVISQTALTYGRTYAASLAPAGSDGGSNQAAGGPGGSTASGGNLAAPQAGDTSVQGGAGSPQEQGGTGSTQTGAGSTQGGDNSTRNITVSTQSSGAVVVLVNGQPEVRRVQTGLSDDVNVEIKSGLSDGDVIVTGSNTPSESSEPSSTSTGGSRSGAQQDGAQQGGGPPGGGGGMPF